MTYPFCAIAPLDQSSTSLGWGVGTFARSPCTVFSACTSRSEGLQFLADAGTPVVAPFPARVTRERGGLVLTLNFPVPAGISAPPARVRVTGINVVAPDGPVELGGLLGRVAPGSRPAATFGLIGGGDIAVLFSDMGLDVVGSERPELSGYRLTPTRGGQLLARSGGPADCARGHGLSGYLLGSAAPPGYVTPDSSVYGRFGPSHLSNRNVSPPGSSSSGIGGVIVLLAASGVAWWVLRK